MWTLVVCMVAVYFIFGLSNLLSEKRAAKYREQQRREAEAEQRRRFADIYKPLHRLSQPVRKGTGFIRS
jgi:hypothetical protein